MKTLKVIVSSIQVIQNKIYEDMLESEAIKQKRKDKSQLVFLESVKKYLLSQPSEDYLINELNRLNELIRVLSNRFEEPENATRKEIIKLRKAHEKEYEIPKLRRQLKTIKFILS